MKIYSLIRRELNNDISIWHFPTCELAQRQMLKSCSQIIGEQCCLNSTISNTYWTYQAGDYYAICDNGNKIEFDIIEAHIEWNDYANGVIVDRVIELYPECKGHYDLICNQIQSLTETFENYLPSMNTKDIDDYINSYLHDHLLRCATDVIFENSNIDSATQPSIMEYIGNQYCISSLIEIINQNTSVIEEVRNDIHKKYGTLFSQEYVYLCEWEWSFDKGKPFMRKNYRSIYKTYNGACKELKTKKEEALSLFKEKYAENELVISDTQDDFATIYDKSFNDMWQGKILKLYVLN